MSNQDKLNHLAKLPGIRRREFMQLAVGAGISAGAASTFWTSANAATPKKGGHLRQAISGGSTTDSLEGGALIDAHNIQCSWSIRNNLTEVDADGNVIGEAAESWEASADALQWVFKVRKGVEFNNGKSVTAEDCAWSINHHRGEGSKSGGAGAVASIDNIKTDGDNVIFNLKGGNADFPFLMADYHLTIVPADTDEAGWNGGIGTGPYIQTVWEPGVRFEAKKNPNYFKSDRGHFDTIENLAINDTAARMNGLQSAELDVIDNPDLKTLNLLEKVPGVVVHEVGGTKHFSMPMLMNQKPFDDNNVRMALKHAVDREALLSTVLQGHGYLGNDHPIGKNQRYYASEIPQRQYDPEKAKWYMNQAGLSSLEVPLHAGEIFAGAVDSAVLYSEHASKAGIKIKVVREPADGYWSNVWQAKPWCMCYWSGRATEDWMFSTAYEGGADWNDMAFAHEKFDKLLVQARAELDDARRREIYVDMQRIVHDEGAVTVPIFANNVHAVRDYIKTPDKQAGNWGLDGLKSSERWWRA